MPTHDESTAAYRPEEGDSVFTEGFEDGTLDKWQALAGSFDLWTIDEKDDNKTARVDGEGTGTYLKNKERIKLTDNYRIEARLNFAEPGGTAVSTVDVLFSTKDVDNSYFARFRMRNGVRYFMLLKRVDGEFEELTEDIVKYDFDKWLDVKILKKESAIKVYVDGQMVALYNEFDPLRHDGVGLGAQGASAAFDFVKVTNLGDEKKRPEELPEDSITKPLRRLVKENLEFTPAGTIQNGTFRIDFFRATWDEGTAYVWDLYFKSEQGLVRLNDEQERFNEQWVVLRGDFGNRRNLYASMTNHWVAFTKFDQIDEKAVELRASNPKYHELRATWSLEKDNPHITFALTPKTDENYVVGYQSFTGESSEAVNEVLCGPLQHAKMIRGVESIGAWELSAPLCLFEKTMDGKPYTFGLYVPPDQIAFEHEQRRGDDAQRYGMSLRNNDGDIQPVLYAPQYGQYSRMRSGQEYEFKIGLYAKKNELFEAYREVLRNKYDYTNYRKNVFGASLTDTMYNLIELMKADPDEDDSVDYKPSPSGWWSRAKGFIDIENDQGVRSASTCVLLSAYYLTNDEELYEERVLPTIEYHVSRNGYGWTPKEGYDIYADPSKHELCSVPFDASTLSPLYNMTREKNSGIYHLALEELGSADDYWLKRTPMSTPLAVYRMTGERRFLREAEERAHEYIAHQIETPYTQNVDPHDFQYFYSKAWTELLEMYEETRNPAYLDASYREAKRYVTQVFVRPIPPGTTTVPDRPLIEGKRDLSGWWKPSELYEYPRKGVPDEEVETWIISQNGMSFEALMTYRINGHTLNPAWAPFLLRLAYYTDDKLLADIAHNTVVGRYANYPGYYYRQFSIHHMKPNFPYTGPPGTSTIYYHHTPVQLGMTMDYLITEHAVRSGEEMSFPGEFEANFVWFKYRVYGHKPGRFYGNEDVWLWMPKGIISVDNYQINWITAESRTSFYISLANESDRTEEVTVSLNSHFVPIDPSRDYPIIIVKDNGEPVHEVMTNGELTTTVSAKGITAIIVREIRPIEISLHSEEGSRSASGTGYFFDDDSAVGPVRGMILVRPDNSRYDAYVQAATKEPAALYYSTDWGETYEVMENKVYPNEWTITISDLSATFTYYVKVADKQTHPVTLSLQTTD